MTDHRHTRFSSRLYSKDIQAGFRRRPGMPAQEYLDVLQRLNREAGKTKRLLASPPAAGSIKRLCFAVSARP